MEYDNAWDGKTAVINIQLTEENVLCSAHWLNILDVVSPYVTTSLTGVGSTPIMCSVSLINYCCTWFPIWPVMIKSQPGYDFVGVHMDL